MNNEENKNQDLTYDFNFENQVVKNEQSIQNNNVEDLNDVEELDELEEVEETNDVPSKTEELEEVLEESEQPNNEEEKKDDTNNKKIKILNKEFNLEDIILVVIGLVIVASIFLLPRIMNIFN